MDKTAVLFARYLFKEAKAYVERELVLEKPNFTTEKLANSIKYVCKELNYQKIYRAAADNNNPILIADLNSLHNLNFFPTTKDDLEAQVNDVRLWVGSGRLIVHPGCKELIGCLKYGVWNDKRTAFEQSKNFGHFDALAALMYLVRNIDRTYNPIPATYGMMGDTHAVELMPKPVTSESGKAIKQLFKKTQLKPMWR